MANNVVELDEVNIDEASQQVSDAKMQSENAQKDDLLKQYYFGCGPCHPKWLQFFANKKFFTFLACCFTCLHSGSVSGFLSVILSTLQTRYQFSSVSVGFIVIGYDLSVAFVIIFVTYFASYFHKPRVLGIGCIVMGIAALLFASPQFIFGQYDGGRSTILNEVCSDNRTITAECSSGNDAALAIFILATVLLSIPSAVLYPLSNAYIDEIVYPRYVSLHIGVFYVFLVIGPAIGYLLGSLCLSVYVDPWIETSLEESDPAWVGAWWIPFILISILSFLLSIPYLMFPKWLADSHLVREERKKEISKEYVDKEYEGNTFVVALKKFPTQMFRLFTNPSFMLASIALGVAYIFSEGVVSFAPKYLENQFYLTSSTAGFITGGIAISSAVVGVIIGSLLTFALKLDGKKSIFFVSCAAVISLPFLLTYIIHCPTVNLAGVTTEYPNGSMAGIDQSSCASMCDCSSTIFEPVCGSDGITYFSACRAGCVVSMDNDDYDYDNCSCIASASGFDITKSTATSGLCESTCNLIAPALVLFFLFIMFVFIGTIPYQYFTLRVVADEQRAMAIGVQSAIWRIIGAFPGPIVFGAVFDISCAIWQDECGRRGNCWLYYNNKLSVYATSIAYPMTIIAAILFFLACLTFPKKLRMSDEKEKETGK